MDSCSWKTGLVIYKKDTCKSFQSKVCLQTFELSEINLLLAQKEAALPSNLDAWHVIYS